MLLSTDPSQKRIDGTDLYYQLFEDEGGGVFQVGGYTWFFEHDDFSPEVRAAGEMEALKVALLRACVFWTRCYSKPGAHVGAYVEYDSPETEQFINAMFHVVTTATKELSFTVRERKAIDAPQGRTWCVIDDAPQSPIGEVGQ